MNATYTNFARDQLFNDLQMECLFGKGELYIYQDMEEGALHFLSDETEFRRYVRKLEANGVWFSRAFSMDRDLLETYGFRAGVLMIFDIDPSTRQPLENGTSSYVAMSFDYQRRPNQFLVAKVML